MKKILFLIAILSFATILTACNQNNQTNPPDENEQVNETEDQAEENKDEATQDEENNDDATEEDKNNEANENESTENALDPANEEKVYENKMFKDVKVSESDNEIVITGKVQVFEGVFDYALFDGEEKLLEDHYQTVGAPSWGDFEIPIDKSLIANAKNEVKFELFAYSAKDGSKENVLAIPLTSK